MAITEAGGGYTPIMTAGAIMTAAGAAHTKKRPAPLPTRPRWSTAAASLGSDG